MLPDAQRQDGNGTRASASLTHESVVLVIGLLDNQLPGRTVRVLTRRKPYPAWKVRVGDRFAEGLLESVEVSETLVDCLPQGTGWLGLTASAVERREAKENIEQATEGNSFLRLEEASRLLRGCKVLDGVRVLALLLNDDLDLVLITLIDLEHQLLDAWPAHKAAVLLAEKRLFQTTCRQVCVH